MLDKEGIKKYVSLYRDILSEHQIVVTDRDIECIESVLDFAVKAYIADKKSFRSPEDK
jgi:hypothetical protein